mmetsp:Transcript_21120/g.32747  ORF Transcript_21120/g.32747 Transcript_21120/m.32747 type:complete len:144 (+) Transcript_21120:467-898(+)
MNYQDPNADSSSQSESEAQPVKANAYPYDEAFPSRAKQIKKAQKHLAELHKHHHISHTDVRGFQNELDWSVVKSSKVYDYAVDLIQRNSNHHNELNFAQVTSPSLFEQVADYFKGCYDKHKETGWKKDKFYTSVRFFSGFTIA